MEIRNEELTLLNIMRNGNLLPLQFAVKEKLKQNGYAFVFDEVGCGKTIEAGICIWDTYANGGKNILIIAPSNLTFNWYAEMLTKFGLDFNVVGGTREAVDIYYQSQTGNVIDGVANLCIASYDSRNSDTSNAAVDRIREKEIEWDLIVLDEGHESKNDASIRYISLSKYHSKKVLFLSATPIKNLQEDFINEFELVRKIIGRETEELRIEPIRSISFDLRYPISRNFKEIIAKREDFKKRIVSEIDYEINSEVVKSLRNDGLAFDQKRNCIMLFENYLRSDYKDVFSRYHKRVYDMEDILVLREFDSKLDALLSKLEEISKEERIVIFCNHIAVIDYLKKVLVSLYGLEQIEAIHGESYEQEERKKRLLLLDKTDTEMGKKRIVILSHNIASVGVNLSKFTHLINYELPYTPADLEQRFGRIDRITNDADKLMLYYFKDKNGYFDTVYLNRIFIKLTWQVLPLLPGKNLINAVTDAVLDRYCDAFTMLNDLEVYLKKLETEETVEKDEIVAQIKDMFEENVVDIHTGKVQKAAVERILSKIKESREHWDITEQQEVENLRHHLKERLSKMNNRIFYDLAGKKESMSYEELCARVYTQEYEEFEKQIQEKGKAIIEYAKQLSEQYESDKVSFWRIVREYLDKKDDMAFLVLYGVFCALKKNGISLSFEQLIKEYNGECVR